MKKPDLTAPRFRPTRYNVLDEALIKKFREKFPQFKDISDAKFREIIFVHNEVLWNTAVEYRDGAEFPEGLGYIFVGSCPSPKKINTDFAVSLKNGKRMRHRNFESDNFLAKIFYTNFANKYKFQHRELWMFKGIRQFTRKVSEVYPENFKTYLQVDNLQHISKMFGKTLRTEYIEKRATQEQSENYNEFDMD